jgi:phosphoserine phosphatase
LRILLPMSASFKLDRVLVATDFSAACDTAVRYAATVAKRFNARLYLLQVLPEASGRAAADKQRAERHATEAIERQRGTLLDGHDDYMVAVVSGAPGRCILNKARQIGADLIVLGICEPAQPPIGKNVVQEVCETSRCPVTCVPCGSASVPEPPGPSRP